MKNMQDGKVYTSVKNGTGTKRKKGFFLTPQLTLEEERESRGPGYSEADWCDRMLANDDVEDEKKEKA